MFYSMLVLLILDALILATVVLLQAGQGGGLASLGGGSSDTVMGGRQAATLLTRMSWWCGGLFLGLSLVLSVMSVGRDAAFRSDLQDRIRQQGAPAGAPAALPFETTVPATLQPSADSGGSGAP